MNSTFRWDLMNQDAAPGAAGVLDADENWERIDYFLERVVPVAEASKVRLACHPHDPYTPPGYRGVTRVLGTVDGLKKLVGMRESPYHGLNFCQGTVGEMLDDPAAEIFDVIRWFGERDKIFNVHFRNIRGRKLSFMETFPEEGDMDMLRSIRLYAELGYQPHDHARPRAARLRARPAEHRLRIRLRLSRGPVRNAPGGGIAAGLIPGGAVPVRSARSRRMPHSARLPAARNPPASRRNLRCVA